jgi:hypothetical protein
MKKIILIIGLMLWLVPAQAPGMTKSGTTTAQFLKIQIGARAIGMGGAYVALANDATAIYWNPAGLTKAGERGSVYFGYNKWLADTRHNFAAVVVKLSPADVFGLSFTSLSMPDMEVRNEFYPEGTGEYFSAMDLAMGASYARQITDRFGVGVTAKYIRQQIWQMSASAIAFDVGVTFRTELDWLKLGMSFANFGPKMQFTGKNTFVNYDFSPGEWGDNENIFADLQTDKWDLPLMFRFGAAVEILRQEMNQLTAVIEARHPNDNTENVNIGGEYGFRRRFFLRAGYQNLFLKATESGLTLGGGMVYFIAPDTPLRVDYAYADWNRLLEVHRFSMEISF